MSDIVFYYDPQPPRPLLEEGVTTGYVVLWSGEPGPAKVAKAVTMVDDEGYAVTELTGDFEDTTVVDDR